eukprot:gene37757-46588_t
MSRDDKWRRLGPIVDAKIRSIPSQFLTLVHGDAKSANITYSKSKATGLYDGVAMYDFQYIGTSPGVRDVVYFLVSSSRHVKTKESSVTIGYWWQNGDICLRGGAEYEEKYPTKTCLTPSKGYNAYDSDTIFICS